LLVIKNNEIVFEHYYDKHTPTTVSNSFSAAKTVVSLLIGCALDEGKIKSLDDKVGKYLPEFNKDGKEVISIRHLLMMSSGLDWQESGKNPLSDNAASYYGEDLYNLVMNQSLISEPGKKFEYQSGNSQILGYIVEKVTGKSLNIYAEEKLWRPIGAENNAYWSLDKEDGDEKAFCCMYATARDFAKLGKLINQKGKWENQTVISESYMEELVQNPKMVTEDNTENYRYGLHIWTYLGDSNPVYYCRGILGQYIISIPDENLVIVRLGAKRDKTVKLNQNKKSHTKEEILKAGHPEDLFELIKLGRLVSKN
jgi:CubicO group peptidase (beta-lactamase class C family)